MLVSRLDLIRSFFRRLRRCLAVRILLVFGLDNLLQAGELFTLVKRNQRHALRRTAKLANLAYSGANQHTAGRDQHDLVLILYQTRCDNLAVAFAGGNGDDTLRSTTGMAEIGKNGALAETVLGCDQHGFLMIRGDQQRQNLLSFAQLHAAHAACRSPHRAHVFFVEPDSLASVGHQNDILRTSRDLGADQIVAFIKRDGDNACLAWIGEIGKRRLLDRALHMKMN